MSVVVRMEMPSGCDKCVFFFGNCILDEKDDRTGYVHFNEVVIADYKGKYAVRKNRPDWCPILCQLPEGHGRLVDADQLIHETHLELVEISMNGLKGTPAYADDLRMMCKRLADEDIAPTIVPEERSET